MYFRASLMALLCLTLSEFVSKAWVMFFIFYISFTRSLSVSLNMSMTRTLVPDPPNGTENKLSQEMLRACMRRTEISMSQLKLFHMSLMNSDYNNDNDIAPTPVQSIGDVNNLGDLDFNGNSQMPYLDLKHNEPLQCFVSCLYETLDLDRYNVLLEEAFKNQVQTIIQHEKAEIKECSDLQGKTRCEAAYKLHLCYNHLKTLEAEQRIREILERTEAENEGFGPEGSDFIDGIQHPEKQ
uniref:Odorant-binding protein 56c n=1 Tax=Drosophila melanogaster TaxID=7227 RepID=A9QHI0_DROME|nr:odorant-binding protein 56c [Drosophila melanogaster]ABW84012.1 odorant-binding protein 56c [Drosophila melanogaster]ABW84014.1 odorant-binding protein 56c [Drosophila melanogaster]ABW84015.1 odorant-binding protein 56c [Drosophila melanogaster]ABW84016.1 odorant-binding protein 56c [Drosophila melanogaster]